LQRPLDMFDYRIQGTIGMVGRTPKRDAGIA
jgi:hypothetical protein